MNEEELLDNAFLGISLNMDIMVSISLNAGLNVNAKYEKYNNATMLQFAAEKGNISIIKMLIENKANIEERNKNGLTAFHIAVLLKHYDVANVLLLNGADINTYDEWHRTPLFNSTIQCNIDSIKYLLGNKADMYTEQYNYSTAFNVLFQIMNDRKYDITSIIQLVKLYLDNGFNPNIKDSAGYNMTHILAFTELIDVWLMIEPFVTSYTEKIPGGYCPLFISITQKKYRTLDYLITKKSNINTTDDNGMTPLIYAVRIGDNELINNILKFNPDVYIKDNENKTAFDYATDEIKRLL